MPRQQVRSDRRVLLHVFSTFGVGGPQLRFAMIVNHLGRVYRHLIIAMDGAYGAAERLDPEVDHDIVRLEFDKRATVRNLFLFRRTLLRLNPQLLITYNWGAIEWSLANYLGTRPHVHVEDGFGPEEASRRLRRRNLFRRVVLARAARVVVPSRTLHEIAAGEWRLDERRLSYIPNGIDCARFAAGPDPGVLERFSLSADEPIVGTVAALRPEKNLARLIRAFARVDRGQTAKLVIVGEGALRGSLEETAAELGISGRVVFVGHLAEPERILGVFNVFALSSDTEQMPISVLEAMAAGLPVAGVDVGDVKRMVAPENRPYIGEPSEAQLAENLRLLLSDAEASRAIGRANRDRAQREFEQDLMIAAYDEVFRL